MIKGRRRVRDAVKKQAREGCGHRAAVQRMHVCTKWDKYAHGPDARQQVCWTTNRQVTQGFASIFESRLLLTLVQNHHRRAFRTKKSSENKHRKKGAKKHQTKNKTGGCLPRAHRRLKPPPFKARQEHCTNQIGVLSHQDIHTYVYIYICTYTHQNKNAVCVLQNTSSEQPHT